jgi:hypothetical protein
LAIHNARKNNIDIQPPHIEIIESYLRNNVHTIDDHYVEPLCKKSRVELSPKENVVEGQMLIV